MIRRLRLLPVGIVVAMWLCAADASAGLLVDSCRSASESLRPACRGIEVMAAAGSATCRWAGAPEAACTTPLGPQVSNAAVDAYEGSWVHRALGLQYALGGDLGLRNAPWVGTHNSFNSTAEMGPTLSDTDANQQLKIVDQLRLDVRSLELDVHTFPSVSGGEASLAEPVVCHARGEDEAHLGCTIEKPFDVVLGEIAGWLRAHDDQVLLLYVEDHMEGLAGQDAGAAAVEAQIGDLVYRPPGGGAGCQPLALDLTREEVAGAGKQVIIVGGCGDGAAWRSVAFDWSAHEEERPRGFTDFPECGTDFDRATYDSNLIRYYEDSTGLTAGASMVGQATLDDGITPETAARMARCGVDLTGFDQLLPDDGRLEAMVWSWATGQPGTTGDCALQRADARWEARPCAAPHPAACRAPDGSWFLTTAAPATTAATRCPAGTQHAAPRTGYENQLLRQAALAAGATEAWLGHRRSGAGWSPLDTRG